eukprot:346851_1
MTEIQQSNNVVECIDALVSTFYNPYNTNQTISALKSLNIPHENIKHLIALNDLTVFNVIQAILTQNQCVPIQYETASDSILSETTMDICHYEPIKTR